MKKHIAIYQDYIHNNGSLFKALKSDVHVNSWILVDAADIMSGALNHDVAAFIMPGGASRYVSDKLNGVGNAKIKEYVASGGTYIGICAGAYYACRRIEWRKGESDEICVDNELGFFPGVAKGPITALTDGDNMASIATITAIDGKTHKTFYWGGNSFHAENDNDFDILASYDDASPAIVAGSFGQGRYILSSPHPEIDSAQLDLMRFDVSDNRYKDIAALKNTDGITTQLFTEILKRFVDQK